MDQNPALVLEHLTEIEEAAEEILTDKQQIIDLDKKRHKTREAIRVLQKDTKASKTWVCFGNMFLKLPKQQTTKLLQKDFDQLDEEISEVRRNLKPKMNKMRDLEHKDLLKGFNLTPLGKDEMKAINSVL